MANSKVGYKSPPTYTQFKPGQSGNAKGRPKGRKNSATMLQAIVNEKMEARIDGKIRRLSKLELIFHQLVAKALKGDSKASAEVMKLVGQYEATNAQSSDSGPRGGVLVVPGISSIDEWENAAMAQQQKLISGA